MNRLSEPQESAPLTTERPRLSTFATIGVSVVVAAGCAIGGGAERGEQPLSPDKVAMKIASERYTNCKLTEVTDLHLIVTGNDPTPRDSVAVRIETTQSQATADLRRRHDQVGDDVKWGPPYVAVRSVTENHPGEYHLTGSAYLTDYNSDKDVDPQAFTVLPKTSTQFNPISTRAAVYVGNKAWVETISPDKSVTTRKGHNTLSYCGTMVRAADGEGQSEWRLDTKVAPGKFLPGAITEPFFRQQ